MTDAELTIALGELGGFQARTLTRIKYRRLYKPALMVYTDALEDDDLRSRLLEFSDHVRRRELERAMAVKLGLDDGEVLLDLPNRELLLSEPRLKRTAMNIMDADGRIRPLNSFSPLARALQSRGVPDWALCLSVPEKHRKRAGELGRRMILD